MDWQAVQQIGLPSVLSLGLVAWLIRRYERSGDQTLDLLRHSIILLEAVTANQRRQSALMGRILHELGVEVVGEEST